MGWLTGGGSGGSKTASPRAGQVSRLLRAHGLFVRVCCVMLGTAGGANSTAQLLHHNQHFATTSCSQSVTPAGWGQMRRRLSSTLEYGRPAVINRLLLYLDSPFPLQAGAEEAPELTPEEYGRLVELVEQQEKGMR